MKKLIIAAAIALSFTAPAMAYDSQFPRPYMPEIEYGNESNQNNSEDYGQRSIQLQNEAQRGYEENACVANARMAGRSAAHCYY